ncbi:hypothetical protein KAR10_09995 [bacterium]|nr:hypothetical protein [bacterium]
MGRRIFAIGTLGLICVLCAPGVRAEKQTPTQTTTCGLRTVETTNKAVRAKRVDNKGNTSSARLYEKNNMLKDFEVHFLVSLPFTAFYSYLTVMSLDTMVQGRFPTEFRQANTWMIMGFAVGGALAVALGSMNRVPDQSKYQRESREPIDEEKARDPVCARLEFLRVVY